MKEVQILQAKHLEYWKIDNGGKASLNKMHKELDVTAGLAIRRLQDKTAEHPVVGQVVFTEQGTHDVLIFRPDLQPKEDHGTP